VDETGLLPCAVPSGPAVAKVLPLLRAALAGTGPALAPYAAGSPAPATAPETVRPGTALVVGTSGSTGTPKRAVLTAAALTASADATHERLGGPGRWLLAMPAQHIAGLQVLIRSIVADTAPVVLDLTGGFRPEIFAAATASMTSDRRSSRLYTALVPTQLGRLLAHPAGVAALARYDGILLGGAAAPPALLRRAGEAGVRVLTTYGMSETAGGCVYDGRPLTPTRVRIDEEGRISLGGATLAECYLGRPDLTERAFHTGADGTRWFRTDDVGRWVDGRLHVEGRVDDLINSGGLKVAPRLVEEALVAHLGGVLEAVVVGSPDPEWGEAVSAAIVMDGPAPTVRDVRDRLRGILPDHALPQRLVTVATIPLRGPGKPDRAAVRGLFVFDGANWQDHG
jgi:O-succinylbenzoic acid--CoA ligase